MWVPGGVEQLDWLGEDVVVDQTSVHGEKSHQQDDVSAAKEHVKNLKKSRKNLKSIQELAHIKFGECNNRKIKMLHAM